jgi:enamine deaminase RidA (YjgF/YER057c/UK114 family)
MAIQKRTEGLGMPWEEVFGYAQAVQVGDTIYISGQLDHDASGTMLAPAPLDEGGRITDYSNMEAQMRQTYANARILLERFGATMDNVVEEVIYVLDMETGFAAAPAVRREAYGTAQPAVASTILVTPRLALPAQLVEIQFKARV